jgi:hypothetical protein
VARLFDGAGDVLNCSVGASGLTGAFTMVIVCRKNSNPASFMNLCTVHTSGGASTFGLEIEDASSGNNLQVQVGSTFRLSTFSVTAAEGYVLLAGGKASGITTPRVHKYVYGTDTWTHQDASGTAGNPASSAGGTVRWGLWETADDFDGDVAATAIFDRNLTDAEVEQMAHSLAIWHGMGPVGMWVFDQSATGQSVVDLTGNGANQSSLTGTAVAAVSVPILSYGHDVLVLSSSADAGGTTFDQAVSGTVTPAGAVTRQTGKVAAGAVTPAGSLVRLVAKTVAGTVTPAGALATIKAVLRSFTGTVTPAGAAVRQVQKPLAGSTTPAGVLVRQPQKRMTGTVTPAGALATIKAVLRSFAGAVTPTGALTRRAGKASGGTVTPAGALVRQAAKNLTGSVTPAGVLTKVRAALLALAGTVTPAGTLRRATAKVLAGAVTPSGVVAKLLARTFAGTVAAVGALVKRPAKSFTGSVTPAGTAAMAEGAAPSIVTRPFTGTVSRPNTGIVVRPNTGTVPRP